MYLDIYEHLGGQEPLKKNYISILFVLVAICLVFYSFSFLGVLEKNIESDARKSQKIDDSWQVSKSISKNLAALIFYDDDSKDFTYSIYLNKDGFSFGYHFILGGETTDIRNGIQAFSYNEGMALISMNTVNAVKVERTFENPDIPTEIYHLEPHKPFAVVISSEENKAEGVLNIYDAQGNSIPINTVLCGSTNSIEMNI